MGHFDDTNELVTVKDVSSTQACSYVNCGLGPHKGYISSTNSQGSGVPTLETWGACPRPPEQEICQEYHLLPCHYGLLLLKLLCFLLPHFLLWRRLQSFAAVLFNMVFKFSGAVPYLLGTAIYRALASVTVIAAPGSRSMVGSLGAGSNSAKPAYGWMHSTIYLGPMENSSSLTKICPRSA